MKGLPEIAAAAGSLVGPAVLSTLVSVKGSSYRKPGARMLVGPEGVQTGVLSAGCLETDLQARVASVLASGAPQLAVFDLGSELDLVWGTGMGCQGRAEVLLEPLAPGATPSWLSLCATLLAERRAGVLATVLAARGPAPAKLADRFLLDPAGPGLLPLAGPLRAALSTLLEGALVGGTPQNTVLAQNNWEVDLLVEPILPPFALWLFGAGEHARPLARLAKELGWFLGVVDHRSALATAERFPEADRIVVGHPPACLESLPFDARSAALVVSHVYDKDRQALEALLRQPLGYLGLQGNRTRSARLLREIEAAGTPLTEAQRRILHAPAGLALGAESPEAIALSMVAEVQAVLSGHPGGSLRERTGRIHEVSSEQAMPSAASSA